MRLDALIGRRRQTLGLLVATALLAVAAAPAAQATPGADYYGATIQPMFTFVPSSCNAAPVCWNSILQRMSSDGLTTARVAVQWSAIEPNAPTSTGHSYWWDGYWDPANMDRVVTMLAVHGLRLVPVLASTPSWAATPGTTQLSPDHEADYAAFVGAFAARYGSNGTFWAANPSVPRLPVQQYEIWTEANSTLSWSGGPNAADYVRGLSLVHQAVRAADPNGQVLASLGWQNVAGYVAQMYASGAKGQIDGVALHAYAPTAPAILSLVRQVRGALVAAGDAGLPIYATEVGQPAATSGAGAANGGDSGNPVSDAARAATLTLAGDALARSDCGVNDYLVYSAVSSGTETEPMHEGFMGIYDAATGLPDVTGAAIAAASQRWRAGPSGGLVVCGGGATAAANMLPLGLQLSRQSDRCVTGHVTYLGNPLEGAVLALTPDSGSAASATSNAYGSASVCAPAAATSYTVAASVPNVATSSTTTLTISKQQQQRNLLAASPCSFALAGNVVRVAKKTTTLKARLSCGTVAFGNTRISVAVVRKGRKKIHVVRRIALTANTWKTFRVAATLHRGDRVLLTHGGEQARGIPKLTRIVTITAKSPGLTTVVGSRHRTLE